MRKLSFLLVISAVLAVSGGCESRQAYQWQYRAGTMYEYNKLMEVYEPESGNAPPLPPPSDVPGEGTWVKVPLREDAVVIYDEHHPTGRVVILDDPWCDPCYPRTYIGTSYFYGPRRYRGSSISIGFGFGHRGPHRYYGRPGRYR